MTTFEPSMPTLTSLLDQVGSGEIRIPDFQRSWVWGPEDIRSLIASVSLSYPIGTILLLEYGAGGLHVSSRYLEKVSVPQEKKDDGPSFLLLDGQQRLTALYLVLRSGQAVPTRKGRGGSEGYFYYLNIRACLDTDIDREDAVCLLPANLHRRATSKDPELDLSTKEKEYENGYFPLDALFDPDKYDTWTEAYTTFWLENRKNQKIQEFNQFRTYVIEPFRSYRVPVITLDRNTEKEAVCRVFEKVNTQGVELTVFELVTASFATDNFKLRDDWDARSENLRQSKVLEKANGDSLIGGQDFLKAVTLLASYNSRRSSGGGKNVKCSRGAVLDLELAEYKKYADRVEEGFRKAANLLVREGIYCGQNVPFTQQLIPLASVCACLGKKADSNAVKNKLAKWYWCGVLGGLYGSSSDLRFANDIIDLIDWVGGEGAENEVHTIRDTNFVPMSLLDLRSRGSGVYKGMMALLMKCKNRDFLSGDPIDVTVFSNKNVDIHHIFPKAHCKRMEHDSIRCNSIINKTPLTSETNKFLGGRAPSEYLSAIEKGGDSYASMTSSELNKILLSNCINPELLRDDRFDDFIIDRASRLLDLIEVAIGKKIEGRSSPEVTNEFGGALSRQTGEPIDSPATWIDPSSSSISARR